MAFEKILIVEDEERMRRLIGDYLKREGYKIIETDNGKQAMEILHEEQFDLMILDIMLPEYDGWTVCRTVRQESNMPIIMLTARSDESDELFGFELGADEYITKPFSPKVLVARVKALLKRSLFTEEGALSISGIELNQSSHRVLVEGIEVNLTPKEYDLLSYLIKHKGKALSRDQLLNGVWGYDYYGDLRTVDTHVKRLRIKLHTKGSLIQTVRAIGYRFEVEA